MDASQGRRDNLALAGTNGEDRSTIRPSPFRLPACHGVAALGAAGAIRSALHSTLTWELPRDWRLMLMLAADADLTPDEAAAVLGMTPEQFAASHARPLEIVRSHLGKCGIGTPPCNHGGPNNSWPPVKTPGGGQIP